MVGTGIKTMAIAWLAALLLLPVALFAAQSKPEVPASAQWRTVTAEELAMTSEPRAPGASAVFLYTEYDRSDVHNRETVYRQLKILTEEGRNFANVSFNYNKQTDTGVRIEARVIHSDGAIIPFNGEIFDRPLVSTRNVAIHVKSLTLPDVRVGSIIEVRFSRSFTRANPARWMLNQPLFTRHARYSLELYKQLNARWSFPTGLPVGTALPKRGDDDVVRLEVRNMPAFVTEDYMPPPDDLVLSVDFSYVYSGEVSSGEAAKYWKGFGDEQWADIEKFLGNPKYVSRRLEKIIANGDSDEQKVRKIYDHVRQMGNVDMPDSMDKKTEKKCMQFNSHVWDVGADGCGNTFELHMYFIALVRAAGMTAVPVFAASRREHFFSPTSMDSSLVDGTLVAVNIDGRDVLLKPGLPFLPYGAMIWAETAVPALKLDKNGGQWIMTTMPVPADAVTYRSAKLTLSEDGVLEGTVVVKHSGHGAIGRVLDLLRADDQARVDALKEDLRSALPVPAEIAVVRQPDWRNKDGIIETEYQIKVPQWAVTAGNRLMVGIGLFGNEQAGKFVTPKREHPIYFAYPFTAEDEIEITMPAGYKVQNAPARQVSPDSALKYVTSVEAKDRTVSIRRALTHNLLLANQSQYPRVKSFYELVRTGDQEQLVLVR